MESEAAGKRSWIWHRRKCFLWRVSNVQECFHKHEQLGGPLCVLFFKNTSRNDVRIVVWLNYTSIHSDTGSLVQEWMYCVTNPSETDRLCHGGFMMTELPSEEMSRLPVLVTTLWTIFSPQIRLCRQVGALMKPWETGSEIDHHFWEKGIDMYLYPCHPSFPSPFIFYIFTIVITKYLTRGHPEKKYSF